ncbi:MAG TPA: hypothetical protein VGK87_15190 [Anaerolineae bacterium]
MDPASVPDLLDQALLYTYSGKVAEAEATLQQAVHIAPGDPAVYRAMCVIHLNLKQYRQSRADARKLFILKPTPLSFWLLLDVFVRQYRLVFLGLFIVSVLSAVYLNPPLLWIALVGVLLTPLWVFIRTRLEGQRTVGYLSLAMGFVMIGLILISHGK